MLPFKRLFFAVSLAILVLQLHQQLQSTGQAFALPLQGDDSDNLSVLSRSVSDSDSTSHTTGRPEAVTKALQKLSTGGKPQMEHGGQQPSTMVTISHGEGGPIKPDGGKKQDAASVDTQDKKTNDTNKDKYKNKGTEKKADKSSLSDTQTIPEASSKVPISLLQKPRSRFCAQKANADPAMDQEFQTLVQNERKRLYDIRKKRSETSKPGSTAPRSLTDVAILAEQPKTVQVVWHVIHDGPNGNLTAETVKDQIDVINHDYKAYGFQFSLIETNRVDNANWYKNMDQNTPVEAQMKGSLRKGDAKVLNLYSVDFQFGLLGFATFPWDVAGKLSNDGVVFQYSSVPGGSDTGYNLGKTLTHEVGHWLGLWHVFQGGCAAPGDYIPDTPPQKTPTSGCPVGKDSCPRGGVDSIHNYMDYSSDACLSEFTEGQAVAMAAITTRYRGL